MKGTAVYDERNLRQGGKHAETAKLQDEKLKEVAFIQSHEFRKPVASIMALMQLIELD